MKAKPRSVKTSNAPLTVRRLHGLRSGQEMIYYRGNFDNDIAASTPTGSTPFGAGVKKYRDLLVMVRGFAAELAREGRVKLEQRGPVVKTHPRTINGRPQRFQYYEYVATGV